jgi:hypothetical protein
MTQVASTGVSVDEQAARQTLQHIHTYTQQTPVVYLPSHDPASAERLAARTVVNEASLATPQA